MAPIVTIGEIEKIENTLGNAVSSHKWIISNFCTLSINTGDSLRSSSFQIASNEETLSCYMQLYPKGCTLYKDYILAKLIHDRQAQHPLKVDMVQMSILNGQNDIIIQQKRGHPSFRINTHSSFYFIDTKNFMESKDRVLVDGALVIQLDVIFDLNTFLQTPAIVNPVSSVIKCDKSKLDNDFEKLLDNEKFSDVKFIVGDETIYSHKVILTSRSQVFEAMFQYEMKENRDGEVHITDVKYEVMKELLRFVYAGKVNGIEAIAKELLVAADKYSMEDLKALCEKSLFGSLDNDNAIQYLILANSSSSFQLKSKVIQFIIDNPDIVDQPEFKTLDSDIMYEVVRAVTRKRVKY